MTKTRDLNYYRGESWFWFMGSYLPASIVYTAAVQAAFRVLERSPSVTAQTRCSHKRTDGLHGPSPKAAPPGFVALAEKCRRCEEMRNSFHASTLVCTPRRVPAGWVRGCVPAWCLLWFRADCAPGFVGWWCFMAGSPEPEAKQSVCVFERKLCGCSQSPPSQPCRCFCGRMTVLKSFASFFRRIVEAKMIKIYWNTRSRACFQMHPLLFHSFNEKLLQPHRPPKHLFGMSNHGPTSTRRSLKGWQKRSGLLTHFSIPIFCGFVPVSLSIFTCIFSSPWLLNL